MLDGSILKESLVRTGLPPNKSFQPTPPLRSGAAELDRYLALNSPSLTRSGAARQSENLPGSAGGNMSPTTEGRELELALDQINLALEAVEDCLHYRESHEESAQKDLSAALTAAHCVQRWGGSVQVYKNSAEDIRELSAKAGFAAVTLAQSTLTTLRDELDSGGLADIGLRIRRATNDDLLTHAEELHAAGYREAAAVVAGCALEIHVRRMAGKATHEPTKFDSNVADLQKAGMIDRNEAKILRGAYGIRNAAAHGNNLPPASGTVSNMISSVRSFLADHGA